RGDGQRDPPSAPAAARGPRADPLPERARRLPPHRQAVRRHPRFRRRPARDLGRRPQALGRAARPRSPARAPACGRRDRAEDHPRPPRRSAAHRRLVIRRPAVFRILLGIIPCAVLLIALLQTGTPWLARIAILGIAAVTLWNPAAGLLAAAGLAPLGAFIIALDGVQNFRLTEAILLAFIAMWLLRPATRVAPSGQISDDGPRLERYAWIAAWLFSVLLVSLCFGLSRQLLRYEDALRISLETIAFRYFTYGDPTGYSDAARIIEGFALVAATLELIRRRPSLARSLPVVLATSAIVAATTTVFLWFGIGPRQILSREAAIGYRFAAHVLDLNAAGSHFAMVLCLALGVAMRER